MKVFLSFLFYTYMFLTSCIKSSLWSIDSICSSIALVKSVIRAHSYLVLSSKGFSHDIFRDSVDDPPEHAHQQKAPTTPGPQGGGHVLGEHKIQFCMAGVSTQSPWGLLVRLSMPVARGKPTFPNGNMDCTSVLWKQTKKEDRHLHPVGTVHIQGYSYLAPFPWRHKEQLCRK